MAPWEIWTYDFEDVETHPVVIFSNAVRTANADLDRVNVMLCTTMRGHTHWQPRPHEVILDTNGESAIEFRASGTDPTKLRLKPTNCSSA